MSIILDCSLLYLDRVPKRNFVARRLLLTCVALGLFVQFPMAMSMTKAHDAPDRHNSASVATELMATMQDEAHRDGDNAEFPPCHKGVDNPQEESQSHELCDDFCKCSVNCSASCGFGNFTAASTIELGATIAIDTWQPLRQFFLPTDSSHLIYHPPKHL